MLNQSPNKIETQLGRILTLLFENEYKFVGDGQFFIGRYNPDFININGQKKIIELFGDYWHNLPGYKERDEKKINLYSEYGYKTLVIWEKEFKNLANVTRKLKAFHKE